MTFLVLSLGFWFSREVFGLAVTFLVLSLGFWFSRDVFGVAVSPMGHRRNPAVFRHSYSLYCSCFSWCRANKTLQEIYAIFDILCGTASIWNMTAISIDR